MAYEYSEAAVIERRIDSLTVDGIYVMRDPDFPLGRVVFARVGGVLYIMLRHKAITPEQLPKDAKAIGPIL